MDLGTGAFDHAVSIPGRALAVILLMLVAGRCPAYGDTPKPSLVFVDGAAATLSPNSSGAFELDVPIRSAAGVDAAGSLRLLDEKDSGCGKIPLQAIAKLPQGNMSVVHLSITDVALPATCYLELRTDGGETVLKQLKLVQSYLTSAAVTSLWYCVWASIGTAILAGLAIGLFIAWVPPWFRLGSPAWEFSKSWTSTTTLVGGVLATALSLSALPDLTRYASKAGYSAAALLLSLVVVVAPFIYVALRKGRFEKDATSKVYSVGYHGFLWTFLLSCAVTLFGGLAQIVVLSLLLHEVFRGYPFWSVSSGLDPWGWNFWSIATWVLGAIMCWYAGYSMYLTVGLQKEADNDAIAEKKVRHAKDSNLVGTEGPPETAKGPLLSWPVL